MRAHSFRSRRSVRSWAVMWLISSDTSSWPDRPQAVQVPAPVCEGVDLRLQGVILHGQLFRCFNTVLVEIAKLPLIAVQFDKFLARGKGRPCLRTALLEGAEEIQVFEAQGLKPM